MLHGYAGTTSTDSNKSDLQANELIYLQIKKEQFSNFKETIQLLELEKINQLCLHKYDRSIVHWLAYYGRYKMLAYLLDKQPGLLLSSQDTLGKTPLHIAAERGKNHIVNFLLEKNVPYHILDNKKRLPKASAIEKKHPDIAELIEGYKKNVPMSPLVPKLDFSPHPNADNKILLSAKPLYEMFKHADSNLLICLNDKDFSWFFPVKKMEKIFLM